jgi:hypothetical protein
MCARRKIINRKLPVNFLFVLNHPEGISSPDRNPHFNFLIKTNTCFIVYPNVRSNARYAPMYAGLKSLKGDHSEKIYLLFF